MGNYCKTCDQSLTEQQNEIIRQSGDLTQPNCKRNNIKENIKSKLKKIILMTLSQKLFFFKEK